MADLTMGEKKKFDQLNSTRVQIPNQGAIAFLDSTQYE